MPNSYMVYKNLSGKISVENFDLSDMAPSQHAQDHSSSLNSEENASAYSSDRLDFNRSLQVKQRSKGNEREDFSVIREEPSCYENSHLTLSD